MERFQSSCLLFFALLAAGCEDDEAPKIPTQVVVEAVNVTDMPFEHNGLPWDPNDGPDVFVILYDKNSNVLGQTRTTASSNVSRPSLPLRLIVNTPFAMDSDSCYVSLWDRDDTSGDPDDLIASTDEWISFGKLSRAGSPRSILMRSIGGELRAEVFFRYQ